MSAVPISASTEIAVAHEELFSDALRAALAGFLAGYSGQTRDAYTLDSRQFTVRTLSVSAATLKPGVAHVQRCGVDQWP
jgi:hypothetical protein